MFVYSPWFQIYNPFNIQIFPKPSILTLIPYKTNETQQLIHALAIFFEIIDFRLDISTY